MSASLYNDCGGENIPLTQKDVRVLSEIIETMRSLPENVEVILVDDEKITALNEAYRNKDSATDVLSFYLSSEHGQIFISVPFATRQAEELDHELSTELIFLVVHGMLHLSGMTHETDEKYEDMITETNKILSLFQANSNEQ